MLSIDDSARSRLLKLMDLYQAEHPVFSFGMTAPVADARSAMKNAYLSGDHAAAMAAAQSEWSQVRDKLDLAIDFAIMERTDVPPDELWLVDSLEFQVPEFLREHLMNARLSYENERFFVRNSDGDEVRLPII
jgi:hypothetical protein